MGFAARGVLLLVLALVGCAGPGRPAVEGSSAWSLRVSHLETPSRPDVDLDALGLGYEHRLRDGFALAAELDLASFDGEPEAGGGESDATGVGLAGLLRWYPIEGPGWRAFVELGLGLLVTDAAFPQGGTDTNGARHVGLGAVVDVTEDLGLVLGIRQQHVSNGKGLGPENPTYEGMGAYLGLQLAVQPRGEPAPARDLGVPEPWPLALRFQARGGQPGGTSGGGAELTLDARLGTDIHGQVRAGLDLVDSEVLDARGLAVYRRGSQGLLGLAYDRQELDAFEDQELSLFGEWYANDLVTVALVAGHEERNLSKDRGFGGLLVQTYPKSWLKLEAGISARDPFGEVGQESLDLPLGLTLALPAPEGTHLSLFAEDDLDDQSRVVGLRLVYGGDAWTLRDQDRAAGPLRHRP